MTGAMRQCYGENNMNAIAHFLVTLVFAKVFNLTEYEFLLALLFGVLIDLDHLVKLPLYLKQNGLAVVRYWNWRTSLQEPVSLLWIVPVSLFLQSWVPVFFFLTHVALDYLMCYEKRPFFPFSDFTIAERKHKIDDVAGVGVSALALLILAVII